ncbi:hypothetical protein J3F84DRAFT_406407 [Trichoderma pleuroticola]
MNTVPPTYSDPEWRWPFRKFSLKHEDLFTTLHDRFNTQTLPLQDLPAFHSDVCELVLECDTLEEFYSALEKRREHRIKELRTAWSDIAGTITVRPAVMACRVCYEDDHEDTERPPGSQNDTRIERWWSFIQYARTPSFDNIVTFFDGYVRDERKNRFAKWTGRRRRPAIEGNPSTATLGITEAAEEYDKPESSRKASPEVPTSSEAPGDPQPASSSGRHQEAQESLTRAYKMIKGLCEFVNVEATVADDAKDLFRFMDKYKMMKGNSEDAVFFGCIFLACRKHNVPRTFSEIFYCFNANKTEVRRVVKQFQDFLHKFPHVEGDDATQKSVQSTARGSMNEENAQGSRRSWRQVVSESVWVSDPEEHDKPESSLKAPTSPNKRIDELCEMIDVGEKVSNKAKNIFRYVDEHMILKDDRQEDIIGACLFTACRIHKVSQKFKEIFDSTNLDRSQVMTAARYLDQPKFPFMQGESAGDSDAQEHGNPESSRKASPRAPSNTSQPTSSTGQYHEAYKEIDALCETINAGVHVSKSAKDSFNLIDKHGFTKGKSQQSVIAGCVLIACQIHDVRVTFEELSHHARVSKEEVRRLCKQLHSLLQSIRPTEAESAPEIPVETTGARNRTNDEDAQEPQQKRRRVMSESDGDSDAERPAASRGKSRAAEAMPTLKRAEKRKRPDDSQDEARDKRPRTDYSSVPDRFQVPDSPIRDRFDGYASSTDPWSSDSSSSTDASPGGLAPIAVPHDDASDMANWPWPRKNTEMPGPSASGLASSVSGQSLPNQHLGAVEASQALPREGSEQPPTSADAVDSKRSKGKSRANHRQRVDKRRSRREQETSSPQKQPLQKNRQERKASPSVDQVVRSRRSSRRDTRQKLLFLGEDGTPCVADYDRKI